MVVAGGPGIGLTDLGEAETSTLATARAMAEMRVRFMQARQAYFGNLLATVVDCDNRAVRLGKVGAGGAGAPHRRYRGAPAPMCRRATTWS